MRQHFLGFTLCLVVGMALSFIVMLLAAVVELPHAVLADSKIDARRMVIVVFAFAVACSVVRAYSSRRRRKSVIDSIDY